MDPNCIIYNGPDIPCYGIQTGDTAADILQIIINNFACITTTTDPFAACLNVNPTFDTNLNGWTLGGDLSWIWVPDYGGSAAWHGGDVIGSIGQNILTIGSTYRITFDLTIIDGECGPDQSIVQVSTGTTTSPWIGTFGTTAIDLTLTCTDNTLFAISAYDNCRFGELNYIFIDNVCVTEVP
jgi:hypothetical protein